MNLHRLLKLSIFSKDIILDDYEKMIYNSLLKLTQGTIAHPIVSYDIYMKIHINIHTINLEKFKFLRFNTENKTCILYYNKAVMRTLGFDNNVSPFDIQLKWKKFLNEHLNYNLNNIIS